MSLTWAVGQKITAGRLNRRNPVRATKPGNETKTSNATPGSDADIVLPLKADTTYDLRGLLGVTGGNGAGDFQYRWSWTNTATVTMGGIGGSNAIASGTLGDGDWAVQMSDATTPSTAIAYVASTSPTGVRVNDTIVVGSSNITLTLQWAQFGSNATGTTLLGGSHVTAYPVE